MEKGIDLFEMRKMDEVFEKIENKTGVTIGEDARTNIINSLLTENRNVIREATEYEMTLSLLSEIYKTKNMAEMFGFSELSEDLGTIAEELEAEIESHSNGNN